MRIFSALLFLLLLASACFTTTRFGEACDDDDDCGEALSCIDEQCRNLECSIDDDCSNNEICDQGVCLLFDCNLEPRICGDGAFCDVDGQCVECECPEGFQCTNQGCVDPCLEGPCPECISNTDCAEGSFCDAFGFCQPNQCPIYCQDNCEESECRICDDDDECFGSCVQGQCLDEGRCFNAQACAADEICDVDSGFCVFGGCTNDAECPFEQYCSAGTCQPNGCIDEDTNFSCSDCVDNRFCPRSTFYAYTDRRVSNYSLHLILDGFSRCSGGDCYREACEVDWQCLFETGVNPEYVVNEDGVVEIALDEYPSASFGISFDESEDLGRVYIGFDFETIEITSLFRSFEPGSVYPMGTTLGGIEPSADGAESCDMRPEGPCVEEPPPPPSD